MLLHLDRPPEPDGIVPTPKGNRERRGLAVRRRCGFIERAGQLDAALGSDDRGVNPRHALHRFRVDASLRPRHVQPWHWRDVLRTDYWNPPTTVAQHARQRILAIILGIALATILAQLGL